MVTMIYMQVLDLKDENEDTQIHDDNGDDADVDNDDDDDDDGLARISAGRLFPKVWSNGWRWRL